MYWGLNNFFFVFDFILFFWNDFKNVGQTHHPFFFLLFYFIEHIPTRPEINEEQRFEKAFEIRTKPSPGSTTLDDVLESLLGLPPTSRSPSPGPLSIASAAASSPGRCRPMLSLPDRQHQRHSCGDIRANASGRSAL